MPRKARPPRVPRHAPVRESSLEFLRSVNESEDLWRVSLKYRHARVYREYLGLGVAFSVDEYRTAREAFEAITDARIKELELKLLAARDSRRDGAGDTAATDRQQVAASTTQAGRDAAVYPAVYREVLGVDISTVVAENATQVFDAVTRQWRERLWELLCEESRTRVSDLSDLSEAMEDALAGNTLALLG